jgi:hypothetical protein
MTEERIIEIFDGDSGKWDGDNAYQGLQILAKYTKYLIQGADHDIIYSVGLDEIIKAGITEEDCLELRRLNWMVEDGECLACFV